MRLTRWLLAATIAAAFVHPTMARAQSAQQVPPEVATLFDQIGDIDKLRVLNPLKLTPDQIDKLIALTEAEQKTFDKKLVAAAIPQIRAMGDDIKATRQKMLSGGGVPKDFDDKVRQIQDDFVKNRKTAYQEMVDAMTKGAKKILTDTQVATASKIAREATVAAVKKDVPGTDEQYYNLYIANVFMSYPRAVQLLKDMRGATPTTTSSAGSPRIQEARR